MTRTPVTETIRMVARSAIYNIIFSDDIFKVSLGDSAKITVENPLGIVIYKAPLTWKKVQRYPAVSVFHTARSKYSELGYYEENEFPLFIQAAIMESEPDKAIDDIDIITDDLISILLPYPNLNGTVQKWIVEEKSLIDPRDTGSPNLHTYFNMIRLKCTTYPQYQEF